jgi:hypothetical protein
MGDSPAAGPPNAEQNADPNKRKACTAHHRPDAPI